MAYHITKNIFPPLVPKITFKLQGLERARVGQKSEEVHLSAGLSRRLPAARVLCWWRALPLHCSARLPFLAWTWQASAVTREWIRITDGRKRSRATQRVQRGPSVQWAHPAWPGLWPRTHV